MSLRPFVLALAATFVVASGPRARAEEPTSFIVPADRDDDDLDGHADGEEERPSAAALRSARPLDPRLEGATLTVNDKTEAARVRVVAEGGVVPWGRPLPRRALLQGREPGRVTLSIRAKDGTTERLHVVVLGVGFRGGDGRDVDLVHGRGSLEREPPEAAPVATATYADPDALRLVVRVPAGVALPPLAVESVSASGLRLDVIVRPTFDEVACEAGLRCLVTEPLRFVVDDIDRTHPVVAKRSLRAEVGGAITVRSGERVLQALRLEGPRAPSVGRIPRTRATLRAFVVRLSPGGAPAIGGTDVGALALLRSELALASATWGQCGISFGPAPSIDVKVVDPPPPFLVAFGNDLGLPASGGDLHFRVDGRPVTVGLDARTTPDQAARAFAVQVGRLGLRPTISPNARIGPGAAGSVDVLVRRRNGAPATVELDRTSSNLDPSLVVRVGRVDLADGLQHFGDMDSMAGTLEERTLLKAFDDGDPTTVEIFVVPAFASGGRIGESFIASDLSSLRNVVILDRAGLRARRSSLTLAHELGHVFLNMPGHPDDYGIDTPTLLMDSDAADASAFGPRRLSLDDCARVMRESGPDARTPLLKPWPLEVLDYDDKR